MGVMGWGLYGYPLTIHICIQAILGRDDQMPLFVPHLLSCQPLLIFYGRIEPFLNAPQPTPVQHPSWRKIYLT